MRDEGIVIELVLLDFFGGGKMDFFGLGRGGH